MGLIVDSIRKKVFRTKLSEYKQTPVSLGVCRESLSDFYLSDHSKILRECFLKCTVSYYNSNNSSEESIFHLGSPLKYNYFGQAIDVALAPEFTAIPFIRHCFFHTTRV